MEAPDRIPAGRFSLHLYDSRARILSCRHGLLLVARSSRTKFLVWNPVTRDQHRLVAPPAFDTYAAQVDGAVLRAAGDAHHFQVVLVSYQQKQVVACIYSSETGVWSDLMSTPVQSAAVDWEGMPAVLVGDSLHWLLSCGGADVILQVNLSRRSLALIQVPSMLAHGHFVDFMTVMRAEGGGLGLLLRKKGFTAQLWKRNAGCDGVASWVLGRTIKLDKLLSLNLEEIKRIQMIAYAQENNVVFLQTVSGVFMVQLESLQFSKLPENNNCAICYPLESVYAAETSIGGGHDGADQDMLVGPTDWSQTESVLQTMMHAARASFLSTPSQLPAESTLQSYQEAVPALIVALLMLPKTPKLKFCLITLVISRRNFWHNFQDGVANVYCLSHSKSTDMTSMAFHECVVQIGLTDAIIARQISI
uniref:F-box protein AT5G49610-like beta-propeller domain-containing protein n=1 Tax=Aegilops tauschii TaxID=37682 RepID=M8BD46_AEGTA